MNDVDFNSLVGETIINVTNSGNQIVFGTQSGKIYKMYHEQDCCESVSVEDIDGDLQDLIGDVILVAEERTRHDEEEETHGDRAMWTFYTIRTIKTSITIRWYGSSNGYYGVSVDFIELDNDLLF